MITKIKSMLETLATTNPTDKIEVFYQVYTETIGFGCSNNYNTPKELLASLPKEVKNANITSMSVMEQVDKVFLAECRKERRRIPKDAPTKPVLVIETDMIVEV